MGHKDSGSERQIYSHECHWKNRARANKQPINVSQGPPKTRLDLEKINNNN